MNGVRALPVAILAACASWWAVPSTLFLDPLSLTYAQTPDGRWWGTLVRGTTQTIATREAVQARWRAEAVVSVTRQQCQTPAAGAWGWAEYEHILEIALADGSVLAGDTATWIADDASPTLIACLDAERPITVSVHWQVMLWGWLPLRPIRRAWTYD